MKRPDGSVVASERPMEFEFFGGKTESQSANLLWGAAADQDWAPGIYEVECKAGENCDREGHVRDGRQSAGSR